MVAISNDHNQSYHKLILNAMYYAMLYCIVQHVAMLACNIVCYAILHDAVLCIMSISNHDWG